MIDEAFADVVVQGDVARAVVRREHAERLCEGHFPGDPIVPGAYLAGLMAALGETLLCGATLAEVTHCAFVRRVRPSSAIVIVARRVAADGVTAEIACDGETSARAMLRFHAAT